MAHRTPRIMSRKNRRPKPKARRRAGRAGARAGEGVSEFWVDGIREPRIAKVPKIAKQCKLNDVRASGFQFGFFGNFLEILAIPHHFGTSTEPMIWLST